MFAMTGPRCRAAFTGRLTRSDKGPRAAVFPARPAYSCCCPSSPLAQVAPTAQTTDDQESPAESGSGDPSTATAPPGPATTIADPAVPVDELALLVKPLTAEELQVEAGAWMELLQAKVREASLAELAVKQKNKAIDKAEQAQESLEKTQEVLEAVESSRPRCQAPGGDASDLMQADKLADQAQKAVEETADDIDQAVETMQEMAEDSTVQSALQAANEEKAETLSDQATQGARGHPGGLANSGRGEWRPRRGAGSRRPNAWRNKRRRQRPRQRAYSRMPSRAVDQAVHQPTGTQETPDPGKPRRDRPAGGGAGRRATGGQTGHPDQCHTGLRAEVTALIDRLNVVLDELSAKLGKTPEGQEHESITPYRLYAAAVGGIQVDVSDTQALWTSINGWLRSDVGGLRLARNLGVFLLWVVGFWLLGWVVGRIVDKALRVTRVTMELMRGVIVGLVRRILLLVGIVLGLSAIGVNVGPIVALIGAAGFVVAFALQNTLSNFASGIMIMIYRPFDVGDLISVGGVTGEARSMNLVTTTIATTDNQLLIVPNNTIWGNIINNQTGSDTRRVGPGIPGQLRRRPRPGAADSRGRPGGTPAGAG